MTRQMLFACLFVIAGLGCDSAEPTDAGPVCADCGRDAGPRMDASSRDAGASEAGTADAGSADAGPNDAAVIASDAAEGAPCNLNRECAASQRCECDLSTGCFCTAGVRGAGVNGIDPCAVGEDCASALCVEGAGDTFYCSDECLSDDDCEAALPRCLDLAFLGRICTRVLPDAGL